MSSFTEYSVSGITVATVLVSQSSQLRLYGDYTTRTPSEYV